MNINIEMGPGSSVARVALEPGETITSEGGAMIAMSGDMSIQTTTHKKGSGNVLKALTRMLSGENLFLNHFTAGASGGELILGTPLPGDMSVYELQNEKLVVQSGSFVAAAQGVEMGFNWQGFKSMFSGESMFWLELSGSGPLIFNSFGAIYPVEVDGEYIVDTGHIVAFQETLNFTISKAGRSWVSSFLGGEGLVCKFKGKGTVWCQSHNPGSFGHELGPRLKPR